MRGLRVSDQSNSVVVFVLIGVLLTVSLAAAIYLVKFRSEQVANEGNTVVAPVVEGVVVEESSQDDHNDDSTQATEDLPVTGIGDSAPQIIAVAVLTGSLASYLMSRRHQRETSL